MVAVVDTGVDVDHPDLAGNLSPASTDIVAGGTATLNDVEGHGTAVSGVAKTLKNDVGMHGVAFNARLLAVRADAADACPSASCGFTESDVAARINYAVAQGARVIILSLGGPLEAPACWSTRSRTPLRRASSW